MWYQEEINLRVSYRMVREFMQKLTDSQTLRKKFHDNFQNGRALTETYILEKDGVTKLIRISLSRIPEDKETAITIEAYIASQDKTKRDELSNKLIKLT